MAWTGRFAQNNPSPVCYLHMPYCWSHFRTFEYPFLADRICFKHKLEDQAGFLCNRVKLWKTFRIYTLLFSLVFLGPDRVHFHHFIKICEATIREADGCTFSSGMHQNLVSSIYRKSTSFPTSIF
ncbi:hypothetical protein F2P56_036896 [Juglans regia]|uniref:Uncharacterized protein n=1 Tax=Juglans regia TaxID=51240 RepID=A0A833TNG7_JUGRE|nr:hypothetical protein F2P56_036896 [Juglans regia]